MKEARYICNSRLSLSREAKQARYNEIYVVLKSMTRNKRATREEKQARYICNIRCSLSHDAKQARHRCNIRRSSSHEARQTLHMK